jgi:plastocyanin
MRRAGLIVAIALAALAWPGAAALAEDQTVEAKDDAYNDFFAPKNVTVNVGDKVTWTNTGSNAHNVVFDASGQKVGGDPVTHSPSATPWTDDFTFTKAGTFQYYCEEHGDKGGVGMTGKVTVVDPNAPPDTKPPNITNLRAKPKSFCTNKSETCDKRGTVIKFKLSERAKVTADIKRKNANTGPVVIFTNKQKKAGKHEIKYSGKGLKPGKYVLRLRARDAAGNTSKPFKTDVKIVKHG